MLIKLTSMTLFILGLANLLYFFFCGRVLRARALLPFGSLLALNMFVYSTLGTHVLDSFNRIVPFMQEFIP